MKASKLLIAVMAYCLLAAGMLRAAEPVQPLQAQQVRTEVNGDAQLTAQDGSYELRFDDPKSSARFCPAEGSKYWDWSGWRYFALDLENLNKTRQMRLTLHFFAGPDWKQEAVIGIALDPQEKRTLRLEFPHRELYQMQKGIPGPRTLDTTQMAKIEMALQWAYEQKENELVHCRISNLRLEGKLPEKTLPEGEDFLPFVDRFGQYKHDQWPGKIHSTEDLQKNLASEAAELAKAKRPADWDRYGGWLGGPKLKATGAFRTEKYQGKWFLVDPDGRLFFLQALDVMYPSTDAVTLTKHPQWYVNPEENKNPAQIAHSDLNLRLKYGKDDYENEFYETLEKRMVAWGFNGIGNWAKGDFLERDKFPYVLQLVEHNSQNMPRIEGSKLKFFDVFDPEAIRTLENLIPERSAKSTTIEKSLKDPYCIGYFIDNEMRFGNWNSREGRIVLIEDILKSPARQPAKQEFRKDLQAKYGEIDKLNKSWNTTYSDWDAFLTTKELPAAGAGFTADAKAFFQKTVDQYFRLGRDAIKKYAPERLYLGCRFLSTECVDPALSAASKKYCDVMTTNIYSHSPANLPVAALNDQPVLIGEFHFGIRDRGMFSPGLCLAGTTQQDRATAYTRFLQGALAHPNIVGACWFQLRDQPLTGRWDGEGYEIGFIDIADTPYREMTRASRDVADHMYRYRMAGKLTVGMK